MVELFAVGSFWFWALLLAELVLLFVFTECENGTGATISLVAFCVALQFAGNVDILGYVWKNPVSILAIAASYLLLGIGWGVFKWRKLVLARLREHDELFAEFLRVKGLPASTVDLPNQYRADWKKEVDRTRDHKTNQTVAEVPLVRRHKAKVIRWMSLWVFSLMLYFLKDMVSEVFLAIYNNIGFFLQKMANEIYSKPSLKTNLEVKKDEEVAG